jgi:hypothetical protein
LMRRCCLIHLKKSSTCQRQQYRSAMLRAGNVNWLVRKMSRLSVLLRGLRSQARLDVAQTLPVCQLCKGHAQKLIEAGEGLHLLIVGVLRHTATEGAERKMAHQLREDELALMHRATPRREPQARCANTSRGSN